MLHMANGKFKKKYNDASNEWVRALQLKFGTLTIGNVLCLVWVHCLVRLSLSGGFCYIYIYYPYKNNLFKEMEDLPIF